MRTQIIDRIKAVSPQGLRLSQELPYDESGSALFLKNPKTVYVDTDTVDQDPLVATLDGLNITNTTTSTKVYFTTDAKNIPANYDSTVAAFRAIRDTISFPGAQRREAFVSTSYEGDLLVTELEYRITKIT